MNNKTVAQALLSDNAHKVILRDGDIINVKKVTSINETEGTVRIVAKSGTERIRDIPLDTIAEVHVD